MKHVGVILIIAKQTMQDWFNFVSEVGDSFLEAYVPIVEKRKGLAYTPEHKTWQEIIV
jgi:coproporphyrinogen III oxidase